jgi:hypothetical protein
MTRKSTTILALISALALLLGFEASAQLTVLNSNVPPGFGQAGYIEAATVDNFADPDSGGTLTMNGVKMIVPKNSVLQFPANTLKWRDLFDPTFSAPVNDVAPTIGAGKTGLALLDNPAQVRGVSPYLPFNALVSGNIDVQGTTINNVTGLKNPPGTYIVGLILPVGQDLGNGGQGFITFIDYAKGRFEVGGTLGKQNTGTVIEINDPTGRYGLPHSPDPRWSVDNENPTIASGNGYPMCVPRVAPPAIDPDCPLFNRPLNPPIGDPGHDTLFQPGAPLQAFVMPASKSAGSTQPDPWKQAPLMLGDYIAYAGVLYKNVPTAVVTNFKTQTYISANTVGVDKLGIYTAPGTANKVGPAYIQLARMVVGTGGNTNGTNVLANAALGIQGGNIILPEPRNNIVVVGFVTDSTQLVDIVSIDIDPGSGAETCRILGTVLPEPGVFQGVIAKGNKGRFRFEVGKGNFQPVTRVYAAYSYHGQLQLPNQTGTIVPPPSPQICVDKDAPAPILHHGGNGLLSGQYHAPMFTFIFPDAPPGYPSIPNNANDIPFLVQGEGGNPSSGPLDPFPPFCPDVSDVPTCQP